jgi:hypothetical protein
MPGRKTLRPLAGFLVVLALAGPAQANPPPGPVGSAFLRTLSPAAPPFGQKLQETYPWDGVRIQRWRRPRPEADWLVVWIDLLTPGLDYRVSDVQYRPGPLSDRMQVGLAQTTRDFLASHGDAPRVDLAVNTVAYWPFPAFDDSPVYLSEPVWMGGDTAREPEAGSRMLGLLPGRALIGKAAEVRAARPLLAFGSFFGE